MTDQQRTKLIGSLVIVLLVSGGTMGVIAVRDYDAPPMTETPQKPTRLKPPVSQKPESNEVDQTTHNANAYTDGTYTATGEYNTPDGLEEIAVTVTLVDDVVTDVAVDDSKVYSREAQEYTARFISGVDRLVVGKRIDNVALSRVSGSSLTSAGFNEALASIKHEAAS